MLPFEELPVLAELRKEEALLALRPLLPPVPLRLLTSASKGCFAVKAPLLIG